MSFAIGDIVTFDLSKSHGGGGPDEAIVIGYTFPDVCVVADEDSIGMPLNEGHCKRIGRAPAGEGGRLRGRYIEQFGGLLP